MMVNKNENEKHYQQALSSFFYVSNIHVKNGRDFLRTIRRRILVIIVLYPVLCPPGYNKEEKEEEKDENARECVFAH